MDSELSGKAAQSSLARTVFFTTVGFFSVTSAYLCDLCVTVVTRIFNAEIAEIRRDRREDLKSRQDYVRSVQPCTKNLSPPSSSLCNLCVLCVSVVVFSNNS